MVKNPELERIGKYVLEILLKNSGLDVKITENMEIQVDEEYKIRMMCGRGLIYVYDFTKKDEDGTPAKELFNKAVHNTQMMHEKNPNLFEELVKIGIIDNRFGYYVTRI